MSDDEDRARFERFKKRWEELWKGLDKHDPSTRPIERPEIDLIGISEGVLLPQSFVEAVIESGRAIKPPTVEESKAALELSMKEDLTFVDALLEVRAATDTVERSTTITRRLPCGTTIMLEVSRTEVTTHGDGERKFLSPDVCIYCKTPGVEELIWVSTIDIGSVEAIREVLKRAVEKWGDLPTSEPFEEGDGGEDGPE